MKVPELIALLQAIPNAGDLDVCVPDYANNQTTSDVRVSVTSVYGTDCLVIELIDDEEEEDDDDDR